MRAPGDRRREVEARLANVKEQPGVIQEGNNLSVVDQLVEEILTAYSKNPDVKSLPK